MVDFAPPAGALDAPPALVAVRDRVGDRRRPLTDELVEPCGNPTGVRLDVGERDDVLDGVAGNDGESARRVALDAAQMLAVGGHLQ